MCIGKHEPGGPSRCSGDALLACQRAQVNAHDHRSTVQLLEREHDSLTADLVQIDDLEAALNGNLSPEREAAMLERAERVREAEARLRAEQELQYALDNPQTSWPQRAAEADRAVDERRQQWQQAIDDRQAGWDEPEISEADQLARWRADYESTCQLTGEMPTPDGLDEYIRIEQSSISSYDEHRADLCSGTYLQEARAEAITTHRALAETLDVDQLDAALSERLASDELQSLVARRDQARDELDEATGQWNEAKDAFHAREPDALIRYDQARERLHEAYSDYMQIDNDLEHHKNVTAQYAGVLGQKDPRPDYTGTTLGAGQMIGDFEEGSREWLEARQTGFGGSDTAKILGLSKYGSKSEVITSKLEPVTDEQVAEQLAGLHDFVGAAPRGHAWEPVLARQFAADNPDLDLRTTKASWKGDENWQNINVDGVLVDKDDPDKVVGIWESKTSNNKADWAAGIPAYYRPQLGQAMDVADVDRAALTVNFDDGTTETYWMGRHDPLDPTGADARSYADRKHELAAAWEKIEAVRNAPPAPPAPPKKNNGRFKFYNNPAADSSHKANADTARQLAVYRGCTVGEAEQLIRGNIDAGMKADDAVRTAYATYSPATDPDRKYVVVDFEVNGTHAGKHQIIQTGLQVTDHQGNVVESINDLHDINPKVAPTVGTGMTEVHGIDYSALTGSRPFDRSPARDRLTQLAADPKVTFVAHNANFEAGFLRAHGIHTARVIDTMNLSRKFDHHSAGAKLSDFTAAHGVKYENAHNAYADVDMTRRALFNFMRTLGKRRW